MGKRYQVRYRGEIPDGAGMRACRVKRRRVV